MIEKPKRPKKPDIQERQPPRTLQELISRYDLDNTKIYDFLDGLVELINTDIDNLNNQKVNKVINITSTGTNLNDYKTEGTYYFSPSYTPTNIPVGVNGWLKVIPGNDGTVIVKQIWYRHGTPNSNDYETYVRTFSSNTWSNWKRFAIQSDVVNKSGDTMTGQLNMQSNPIRFGSGGNIFFKEDGYGDKFRILPYFGGAGSGNTLILQSTIGGAGEDPQNWKDLVAIHADTGEIDILDTEISVTAYINNGGVVAKKIGKLVIVEIHCSMENLMPNTWTNYNLAKLNGVTAKYRMNSTVVDQSTGLCADVTIEPNSDTIVINKRNVSSINGGWLRGQLIFIAN